MVKLDLVHEMLCVCCVSVVLVMFCAYLGSSYG
jgi:hypothetical protein